MLDGLARGMQRGLRNFKRSWNAICVKIGGRTDFSFRCDFQSLHLPRGRCCAEDPQTAPVSASPRGILLTQSTCFLLGLEVVRVEKLAVIKDQEVVGAKRDNALDRGQLENAAIGFNKQG